MKKGSFALRLFLYASLVSLIWLGSYVVLSGVFAVPDASPVRPAETVTPAIDLPCPAASQWSIVAVVDEEREVTDCFFRYADFLADTLVFVDVPVDTKAELAVGGYEVLSVYNPELPELFMISDLCHIFSEETWCMAAEEVGVALLGIRPKECYIIEKELYESMTETVEGQVCFKTPVSLKETIAEVTEQAVTNDTFREELVYLESYRDIDSVFYRKLPGEALAEEYQPDYGGIALMTEQFQTGVFEGERGER